MTQEPFDEDKIKAALRQKAAEPDPAAFERAMRAALSVYDKELQERSKKSFRGFGPWLRHMGEAISNMEATMRIKIRYAAPALAAILAVVFVGFYGSESSVRMTNRAGMALHEVPGMVPQAIPSPIGQTTIINSGSGGLSSTASNGYTNAAPAREADPLTSLRSATTGMASKQKGGREASASFVVPTSRVQTERRIGIVDSFVPPSSDTAQFGHAEEQEVKQVAQEPVSTFSLDVDTASYTFVRKMLSRGQLPPPQAVRVEEMINYFPYRYKGPDSKDEPFAATVVVYPCPWNKDAKLLHVGVKAYQIPSATRPKANLVFLIDVSGSMSPEDRLPMLKNALAGFVDSLKEDDTIGIVTYAGEAGIALEPTPVREKGKIMQALAALNAGGGTAGGAGLTTAYDLAERSFNKESVNRVILASDGDFNIGVSDPNALQRFIEGKRDKGIYLTILGVGENNLNDALMQRLAQYGNGTAAYLDSLTEARRVLGEQVEGALVPVANDAKVQVEFNPARVAGYRLIGYETRNLRREDFNNDKVDAGDVGSGQTVTAIYEITTTDSKARQVDPLRYGETKKAEENATKKDRTEYAFLKIRYKLPGESTSKLMTQPVGDAQEIKDVASASSDLRFAASVAGFGQLLRNSTMIKDFGYGDVLRLAEGASTDDADGLRREFLTLVRSAKTASELNGMPQQGVRPE